jgi:hypothetical protein
MSQISSIVSTVFFAICFISCGEATLTDAPGADPVRANATPSPDSAVAVEAKPTQTPAIAPDRNQLAGTWQRTDASYQLVISDIAPDGTMKATYLNPNPIHVSKANWVDGKKLISIFVELKDVNYPGSNYSLIYNPNEDVLVGKYFQAVEGMTYDVSFSRLK